MLLAKHIERFADQTIILGPLSAVRLVEANAVRRCEKSEDLITQRARRQRFHLVVHLEAEHFQEFHKGGPGLGEFGVPQQFNVLAVERFGRNAKRTQPAVVT